MTKLVTFNLNSSPIKASTNNYSYTEKTNPMNIHTSDNAYTGADYNYSPDNLSIFNFTDSVVDNITTTAYEYTERLENFLDNVKDGAIETTIGIFDETSDGINTTDPIKEPIKPETTTEPKKEETTKPETTTQPRKEETPEPETTTQPKKEETTKPETTTEPKKEETTKPETTTQPKKEETTKPETTTEPKKEETTKPETTTQPKKEETTKPETTTEPKKEETTKPKKEETTKPSSSKTDKYTKTKENSDGSKVESFDSSQYNLDGNMSAQNNSGQTCVVGAKKVFNDMYGDADYAPEVGNAAVMDEMYADNGNYNVDTTPKVGAMMNFEANTSVGTRWSYGENGHVEIVKSIEYNADGSIKSITTVGSAQTQPSHTYSAAEYNAWMNDKNGPRVHFISPK